jgi:hypothetical protein
LLGRFRVLLMYADKAKPHWHGMSKVMIAQLSLAYSTGTCLQRNVTTYLTAEPHVPSGILMQPVAVQQR